MPHTQPDGATAKVLREGNGEYTVVITNADGLKVTVKPGLTKPEVRAMAKKNEWYPPPF